MCSGARSSSANGAIAWRHSSDSGWSISRRSVLSLCTIRGPSVIRRSSHPGGAGANPQVTPGRATPGALLPYGGHRDDRRRDRAGARCGAARRGRRGRALAGHRARPCTPTRSWARPAGCGTRCGPAPPAPRSRPTTCGPSSTPAATSGAPTTATRSSAPASRSSAAPWARTGYHVHLHSHMAAVLPQAADRGIGTALKLHQRAWALRHEIDRIVWTFDPLVRRNARLNLTKLGGVGVEYLVDFYGADGRRTQPGRAQRPAAAAVGPRRAACRRRARRHDGPLSRDGWVAVGAEDALVGATRTARTSSRRPRPSASWRCRPTSWRSGATIPRSRAAGGCDVRDVLEPVVRGGGRVVALTTDGHYVVEVGS